MTRTQGAHYMSHGAPGPNAVHSMLWDMCHDVDPSTYHYTTSYVTSDQWQFDRYTSHDSHKQVKYKIFKKCMNRDRHKCQSFIYACHM